MKWNLRCDCAPDRNPLICSIHVAEDGLYLHRPPLKDVGATGRPMKRDASQRLLDPHAPAAEVVQCSRCRNYFALTTGLIPAQPGCRKARTA